MRGPATRPALQTSAESDTTRQLTAALPFAALILLALVAQLWADLHWQSTFDSDEAIVGLMAAHVVHGRVPLYFYGQRYLGSLDAILSAPLVALLSYRVLALRVVPLIWFATFLALLARLVRRLFGRRVALLSIAALALPGWRVLMFTARSNVNFGAMATLGTALLLLVVEPWPARRPAARLALIGALTGFGLWVHPLFATYAAAALVVWWLASPEWGACYRRAGAVLGSGVPLLLLGAALVVALFSDGCAPHPWLLDLRRVARLLLLATVVGLPIAGLWLSGRRKRLLSGGASLAGGLVVGSSPLWAGWLLGGVKPTSARIPACPAQAMDRVHLLTNQIIPAMWGAPFLGTLWPPRTVWDVGWLVLLVLQLGAVVVYLWRERAVLLRLVRLAPLSERQRDAALIVLLLLGPIALTILSGNIYDVWHVRYLLITWQADAIVLALLLDRLWGAWRLAALSALALLVLVVGGSLIAQAPREWAARPEAVSPSAATLLMRYLQAEGYRDGYAGYWTAYALDYLSAERLTLTPLGQDRYPPYTAQVSNSTELALLLPPGMVPANQSTTNAVIAAGTRAAIPQFASPAFRERVSAMRILNRRTVGDWDVWLLTEGDGG